MNNQIPLIMSVEQAANYLNVSRATAYNWCTAGILPSFKVGNTRRIRREKLMEWIERQEQASLTASIDGNLS